MRPRKFVRSTALVLVLTAALTVTAFAADPTQQPATKTDNKSSYYASGSGKPVEETDHRLPIVLGGAALLGAILGGAATQIKKKKRKGDES